MSNTLVPCTLYGFPFVTAVSFSRTNAFAIRFLVAHDDRMVKADLHHWIL
jgi:hypothetical protein